MQELFVWVPIKDGVIAGEKMTMIPSHTFAFDGYEDVPVPDIDFSKRGAGGWNEAEWKLDEETSRQFAEELTALMKDGTIHSPNDLSRYPHLGFLRNLNHNPYADSGRLHIILIPQ